MWLYFNSSCMICYHFVQCHSSDPIKFIKEFHCFVIHSKLNRNNLKQLKRTQVIITWYFLYFEVFVSSIIYQSKFSLFCYLS